MRLSLIYSEFSSRSMYFGKLYDIGANDKIDIL